MATRTRAWLKLGALVTMVVVLTTVFVGALDLPNRSHAWEAPAAPVFVAPAPVDSEAVAPPAADLSQAFVSVSKAVRPAVVFVSAERRNEPTAERGPRSLEDLFNQRGFEDRRARPSSGSGFVVSTDGYILTNNHVIEGADGVTVRFEDRRQFKATVVGGDSLTDVAVLKIDATDLPSLRLADSDFTEIGEWVLAVGNPLGEAFAFTVTAGIISGRGRGLQAIRANSPMSIQDFIQTDAAINPGNSGGPLVNLHGEAIGINSAIASPTGFYTGYGFAIPSKLAQAVMDQLIEFGRVRRAVLGVNIMEVNPEAAEYVRLGEIAGVVVSEFSEDSPAKQAGIRKNDVIVALDGEPVHYVAQLQQLVGFKKPGETVEVTVQRRGGIRRTFPVKLSEAPEPATPREVASEPAEPISGDDDALRRNFDDQIGIRVREIRSADRRRFPALRRIDGGVYVWHIDEDGPARGRLVQVQAIGDRQLVGDVIVGIDERPVTSIDDVTNALARVHPGDVIALEVYNIAAESRRPVFLRIRE